MSNSSITLAPVQQAAFEAIKPIAETHGLLCGIERVLDHPDPDHPAHLSLELRVGLDLWVWVDRGGQVRIDWLNHKKKDNLAQTWGGSWEDPEMVLARLTAAIERKPGWHYPSTQVLPEREKKLAYKIEYDRHVMYTELRREPLESFTIDQLRSLQKNLLSAFLDVEGRIQERIYAGGHQAPVVVSIGGFDEWATLMRPEEEDPYGGSGDAAGLAVIAAAARAVYDADNEVEIRKADLASERDERAAYFLEQLGERVNPSDPPNE